jgi:hypothetical protein
MKNAACPTNVLGSCVTLSDCATCLFANAQDYLTDDMLTLIEPAMAAGRCVMRCANA